MYLTLAIGEYGTLYVGYQKCTVQRNLSICMVSSIGRKLLNITINIIWHSASLQPTYVHNSRMWCMCLCMYVSNACVPMLLNMHLRYKMDRPYTGASTYEYDHQEHSLRPVFGIGMKLQKITSNTSCRYVADVPQGKLTVHRHVFVQTDLRRQFKHKTPTAGLSPVSLFACPSCACDARSACTWKNVKACGALKVHGSWLVTQPAAVITCSSINLIHCTVAQGRQCLLAGHTTCSGITGCHSVGELTVKNCDWQHVSPLLPVRIASICMSPCIGRRWRWGCALAN